MVTDNPNDEPVRSSAEFVLGTRISKYNIISLIGSGGMGDVFLAEDTDLNRKVAVKFLARHLCREVDCRARFKREAQAAAQLDHVNIVPVYEVGEFQGRPYFTMACAEGETLKEIIKRGELSKYDAVSLALQICSGLEAAHKSGIIHRDIKPSNIIVDSGGRARLLDFGLATIKGADRLTKTGSTLGTVGYMSPEQVTGGESDGRSDLFSVGVVLYEMLTGRAPFAAEHEAAILYNIVNESPGKLSGENAEISPELERIVHKLLEKKPESRYQTAADVISDLKNESVININRRKLAGRLYRNALLTVLSVFCLAAGYWIIKSMIPEKASSPEIEKVMIAVLPFENLGNPADAYFADGITDEITSRLAKIAGFGVISRTSAIQYKGATKGLPTIARELGVDYILEGTVRWEQSGQTGQVRITPQLINAESNTHIWTDIYESALTGIFEVQATIALKIARELNVELIAGEREAVAAKITENSEALTLYLRGKELLGEIDRRREDIETGIYLLKRSVETDSLFAEAWSQLGFAHLLMYQRYYDRTPARLQLVLEASQKALDISPLSGDAHLTFAYYYYWGRSDYKASLQHLDKANAGLAGSSDIYYLKALIQWSKGEFDNSLKLMREASLLDPLNARISSQLGDELMKLRRYDQALEYFNESLTRRPDQQFGYLEKARAFMATGELDSCLAALSLLPDKYELGAFWVWNQYYGLRRDWDAAIKNLDSISIKMQGKGVDDWLTRLRICVLYSSGDITTAKHLADSLKNVVEDDILALPASNSKQSVLAELYAVLGEDSAALSRIMEYSDTKSKNSFWQYSGIGLHEKARICVMVGQYDMAIDALSHIMTIPYDLSADHLRLDSDWDKLRDLPRFKELIGQYEKSHPL